MLRGWHFHIYFNAEEAEQARELAVAARDALGVPMGRVRPCPIGPHPRGSCQLSVSHAGFSAAIEWMMERRGMFTVLVHGLSGDDLIDHTRHALWLGDPEALDLTQL